MQQGKTVEVKVVDAKVEAAAIRQALSNQRANLSFQIDDLTKRRNELQSQRHLLTGDRAASHDARIAVIDDRVARLEKELFVTNDRIFQLDAGALAGDVLAEADKALRSQVTSEPGRDLADDLRLVAQDAVFEAFGMSTMALLSVYVLWRGFRRYIWKRQPAQELRDNSGQLHQLQQSMDVIALEVERISEAQRYAAKLLTEKGEKSTSVRA